MQNDPKNRNEEDDLAEDEVSLDDDSNFNEESVETVVMAETDFTDNVGDVSVEINVEELVAEVESEQDDDAKRKSVIRRRLEEVTEGRNLKDTFAVDFEND